MYKKFIGAVMIAAGTTVGAGMLALPILTGLAGFVPAVWVYIFSWLVMSYASLLLLEVNLWMNEGANLVSMVQETLGSAAKYLALITYLFLFYSVCVAYLAGGSSVVVDMLASLFGWQLSHGEGILLLLALVVPALYLGTHTLATVNMLLIAGLMLSYFFLLYTGKEYVHSENLIHKNWEYSLFGLPVIITSFTFQNVIPSLTAYLKGHVRQIRWVILLGGLIPLMMYILWEWLVLGVMPLDGPSGIQEALTLGVPATHALQGLLQNPRITLCSDGFSFCAILTSFLGVVLGLFDFLADGTRLQKKGFGKILLCGLIFIPPVFFSFLYPRAFFTALGYAGGIGCVILFLLLPPLMVWKGRYCQKRVGTYRVKGGKIPLVLTMIVGLFIFSVQIGISLGWISNQ